MNIGKLFEKEFVEYFCENHTAAACFRIEDYSHGEKPADVLLAHRDKLYLIELKASEKDHLTKTAVKRHQQRSLLSFSMKQANYYGLIVVQLKDFIGYIRIEDFLIKTKTKSVLQKEDFIKMEEYKEVFTAWL